MSVTPNFSWPLIEPTDFVTNLPADFETFADDVDADVYAVKQTADAALPETIIDAAGDLIYGSAADTAARLAIGTAGQILQVNSGATAPEWITPAGAASMTQLATGTLSGSQLSLTSISQSYKDLILILRNYQCSNFEGHYLRVNSVSSTNAYRTTRVTDTIGSTSADFGLLSDNVDTGNNGNFCIMKFNDYANTTSRKTIDFTNSYKAEGVVSPPDRVTIGAVSTVATTAISSIQTYINTRNWSGGTYILYGVS